MAKTGETTTDADRLSARRIAQDRTARWVRVGLVLLAVPQLVTGLWAVIDPRHWYENFPGFEPSLVAADPPFSAHLASDAGAGFVATGVVLLAAALWAGRGGVLLALLAYVAFAVPHFAYHLTHASDGLTSAENVVNNVTLAIAVVVPLVLGWGAHRGMR